MSQPHLNLSQVGQQRLDGLNAWVVPVAIDDLPGQGPSNASFSRDQIPGCRATLAQAALDVLKDGFHPADLKPISGIGASPVMGLAPWQRCDMRPRDILASNIRDLTASWPHANKHKALREASGIPNGTLERIEKAAVSAGIDWLEPLAQALGVEPWELLVPAEKRVQLRSLFQALMATTEPASAPSEKRQANGRR
jgi:hypothetical protein